MSDEAHKSDEIKIEKEFNLSRDFPPSSKADWKEVATAALKGASFEKKLVTRTYEGIDLQPIYTAEDLGRISFLDIPPGFPPYARGSRVQGYLADPWEVCQEIPYTDPEEFNRALKNDLQRGLSALNLGPNRPEVFHLEDLGDALEGINLEFYPLYIQAGYSGLEMTMLLNALLRQRKINPSNIRGAVEADPMSVLAAEGSLPIPLSEAIERLAVTTRWAIRKAPALRTIGISGLPYHDAGANAVQELACVIATGTEYLRRMIDHGLTAKDVANHIRLTLAVGPFFFMEVAKLRATRICWSKIIESFDPEADAGGIAIHTRTSRFHQTKYDPYVNMLRTTTESFSALVGGVDSLHTGTFDEYLTQPDAFSRRIARNTQLILNEEAFLGRTIDPAGGSYYVESLTHRVAEAAWDLFQEIESKGGMAAALKSGFPQTEINKIYEQKLKDTSRRKNVVVGTNMYANIKEKLKRSDSKSEPPNEDRSQKLEFYKNRRNTDKFKDYLKKLTHQSDGEALKMVDIGSNAISHGATLPEVTDALRRGSGEPERIESLTPHRIAEIFEDLREAVEVWSETEGSRPKLFLINMGSLSQHKARADFSRAFFEVGGFDVIYPPGFEQVETAVQSAIDSGTEAAVICSTDDTYPDLIPQIARGIKKQKPRMILILAGHPGDLAEQYQQAGIDEFIYMGINAPEILNRILKKTGVLAQ